MSLLINPYSVQAAAPAGPAPLNKLTFDAQTLADTGSAPYTWTLAGGSAVYVARDGGYALDCASRNLYKVSYANLASASKFTIKCKYNPQNADATKTFIYAASNFTIRKNSDNTITALFYNSAATLYSISSTVTVTVDTWYDLKIVMDSTHATPYFKLYIDGVERATTSSMAALGLGASSFEFDISLSYQAAVGYIDEVEVYNDVVA
jgi:hypothetical protein